MTLGQLSVYLKHWIGTSNVKKSDEGATDIDLFNIMAGIPKVVRKK